MSAFSFDARTKTSELSAFHKVLVLVQWLHFIAEVDTFTISDVMFLRDSVYQKLLNLLHFSLSYFKKIKVSSLL